MSLKVGEHFSGCKDVLGDSYRYQWCVGWQYIFCLG